VAAVIGAFSVHRLGEHGLLLDHSRQRLYALNPSAAVVWRELERYGSPTGAAPVLAERLGVPVSQARSYAADVLEQFDTLPVIRNAAPESVGGTSRALRPSGPARRVMSYELLDRIFRLHFMADRLFEVVHPLIEPLALSRYGADRAVDVLVVPQMAGVAFIVGDEVVATAQAIEHAAVVARACLLQLAIKSVGGLCTFHASALCRNGQGVLLPGESGVGKSTLAATLAARDFKMLADDSTVLAGHPLRVGSLPEGLCIRRSAFDLLRDVYPRLGHLQEWRRPDGQLVRYLVPGRDVVWAQASERIAIRQMVFPQYIKGEETQLAPLAQHDALLRLLQGVHFLAGSFDRASIESLIAWIKTVDCYELRSSSPERASQLVDDLTK
jgi:hypothetical protein